MRVSEGESKGGRGEGEARTQTDVQVFNKHLQQTICITR